MLASLAIYAKASQGGKPGRVGARVLSIPTIGKCGVCTDCTCITNIPTSCGPTSVEDATCEPCVDTMLAIANVHIDLARIVASKEETQQRGSVATKTARKSGARKK
jgi:hypothetical protein